MGLRTALGLKKPKSPTTAAQKPTSFASAAYWEQRYSSNGTSGAGSYGRLAEYKAEFINLFVEKQDIQSVIELGCGDGNQLSLAKYPKYFGFDVSETAIWKCRTLHGKDFTKKFDTFVPRGDHFDLGLSLDVIFHLIEDDVFTDHMRSLFDKSERFVVIYSSNVTQEDFETRYPAQARHVRHRKFTDWIAANAKDWSLLDRVTHPFPFEPADPDNTSFADFFVFAKS